MDAHRLGTAFRAVRIRKRWRQVDLAVRAGVSATTISRIEGGRLHLLAVGTLLRVGAALDVRVDWQPRWRGAELDRMINAGHAAMHEAAAARFSGTGWVLAPETTFSIYGERGAIDILAHHPPTASLLVVGTAFPDDGRRMRAWSAHPDGEVRALGFLSDSHTRKVLAGSSGVQRVRRA